MNTPTPSSHLPVIAGHEIAMDEHGRFSLNAIHHASGTGKEKMPSNWARSSTAIEQIQELTSYSSDLRNNDVPVMESRKGRGGGTFAHELLAVSYAGWINPRFQLQVNQVFLDYRIGNLKTRREAQPSITAAPDPALTIAPEDYDYLYSLCEFTEELHRICQRHQIPRAISLLGLSDGARMDVLVGECHDIAKRLQCRYLRVEPMPISAGARCHSRENYRLPG